MTSKKPPTRSGAKPKRRSPISRDEGERRLKAAARTLISERPFTEVGVREIATAADVNHGFVHTWFGSKNDLLLAVLRDVMNDVASRIAGAPPGIAIRPFDADTELALRLTMFLALEGVSFGDLFRSPIVMSALAQRFESVDGLTPEQSRIAAQQAVAIGAAAVLFGDFVGATTNEDVAQLLTQWRRMVRLLAEHGDQ